MLNRKEDVIKKRMGDLKVLLGLMDDDQWNRLTYRLAVLTKNESISSLEKPDLEQKEKSEQADTTKKELDKLIKNLSDPTYNITRMSLDEIEDSYKKYKELLDKKDTGAIWCLVEDMFDKQRELCDKAPKTTEEKDSEDKGMLGNVGSALNSAAQKTSKMASDTAKTASTAITGLFSSKDKSGSKSEPTTESSHPLKDKISDKLSKTNIDSLDNTKDKDGKPVLDDSGNPIKTTHLSNLGLDRDDKVHDKSPLKSLSEDATSTHLSTKSDEDEHLAGLLDSSPPMTSPTMSKSDKSDKSLVGGRKKRRKRRVRVRL